MKNVHTLHLAVAGMTYEATCSVDPTGQVTILELLEVKGPQRRTVPVSGTGLRSTFEKIAKRRLTYGKEKNLLDNGR